MLELGYLGAAVTTGLAGLFGFKSRREKALANAAEEAVGKPLPKVEGETVYTAIACTGKDIAQRMFSDASVLLGRVTIEEEIRDVGVGPVVGGKGEVAIVSTTLPQMYPT